MKLVHVTTVPISLHGLLLNQMQSQQAAGYEVIGMSAPGPEVADIEAAGIRHIAVPMTRNLTPLADLQSLFRLVQVMRRERFTIVHTHTPKPGLLGQLAARIAGVPIVINTVHGFYFHDHMRPAVRRFFILLETIAARCSDSILSQNSEDMQTAIREGICPPSKIAHLGNGIDLSQFEPGRISTEQIEAKRQELGLTPDMPVIGFVGRLAARRKGFLDFMEASRRVLAQLPNARVLVVGERDEGKADGVSPSVASDYGIADRCIFLGRRPNSELPLLYCLMNVLVLPSLFEGVPRVIMECAAMGVPAVASDVKGNREAVRHGENGLLTPFGNVDALAAAIGAILTNGELAQRMSTNARRMAETQFNEQRVFKQVKADYARLLRARGLDTSMITQEA